MKKTKKFIALILVLTVAISAVTFTFVSAEEEETYFSAPNVTTAELFDITNKASQTIKQKHEQWRYGYMPVDGKASDFTEYTFLEFKVEEREDEYWISDPAAAQYGDKKNGLFWLPMDPNMASAAVFTAPRDGKINITSDTQFRAREDSNANPANSNMKFKALHNDKVVINELILPPAKYVKFPSTEVDVKKGDKIVYMFYVDGTGRTNVEFVPAIEYVNATASENKDTKVTVEEGKKIIEPMLEPGVQFDIVNKSSGKIKQIHPLWRYGFAPIDGKVATDFSEFNLIDRMPPQEKEYWINDASNDVIGGGKKDGRTWTPLGEDNAGTTTFKAPATGTITIDNENDGIFAINDKNGNPQKNDSGIRILHNDKIIFPAKGNFMKLKEDVKYTFEPMTLEVKEGDILAFQYITEGQGRTNIYWSPSITYGTASQSTDTDVTTEVTILDIAGTEWALPYIKPIVAKNIMSLDNGNFEPERAIRREEFAEALMRTFGLMDDNATVKFADVSANSPYYKAIASAKKVGVVNGISDNEFGIGMTITREQMAAMIYRAVEYKEKKLEEVNAAASFADDGQISDYAKTAVYAMQKANIINGKGDNKFAPQDNATRAETAKILSMLL